MERSRVERMLFEDATGLPASYAKDPCVVWFSGQYFLYYSRMRPDGAFEIGVARGDDLENWEIAGALQAEQPAEGNGVCAPGGIVIGNELHLFYQSYGQFPKDYICHAVSRDGITFTRDTTNPIIQPMGGWNIGRAIDADVVAFQGQLFLYWATRDPLGKVQMLGVSSAPLDSDFSRACWTQRCDAPILKPELPWEKDCIEAPAAVALDGRVFMFYAGAYNCAPQQIGCAVSTDGVHFTRVSDEPLLRPGAAGSWNACESGHPYAFEMDGQVHLFYQGSPDYGKSWRLSHAAVIFENGVPRVIP